MKKYSNLLNKFDAVLTIVSIAASTYEIMQKTFKWYEKKYGRNKTKEIITKPIIKGGK